MKRTLLTLFITLFLPFACIDGMELVISSHAYAPQLPEETIAQIAGSCRPREKNTLMRLCKDFYKCLKNRELILRANPSTVSTRDKIEDMFVYTYANNIEMMKFLLENGVKADCKNILSMTLFHVASDNKNKEATSLLIDHGADVNILKPHIHLLHEATYKGDEEAVKELLKLKVNPDIVCEDGTGSLSIATCKGYITIVESLLFFGAQVNLPNMYGCTPLHLAVSKNYTDIAQLLIESNAQVNVRNNHGDTPLLLAIYNGDIKTVKLLLSVGADINSKNNNGDTPLSLALIYGYIEIVKLLISIGTDINSKNNQGETPFLLAIGYGNIEIVQLLLNNKADINPTNNLKLSPLCNAIYHGNIEIVQLLLNNKADIYYAVTADSTVDTTIKKGDTPLQIAHKKGHTDIAKLLQERLEYDLKNNNSTPKENKKENCTIQ